MADGFAATASGSVSLPLIFAEVYGGGNDDGFTAAASGPIFPPLTFPEIYGGGNGDGIAAYASGPVSPPLDSQACVQPLPGMVAWWPMDDTSGTSVIDIAGNYPGISVNGTLPQDGHVGGGMHFDGIDDYIAVADNDAWAFGTNDFTIELWANFDTPGGGTIGHPGDVFLSHDDGPGTQIKWFFALGGGYLNFHVNGTGNNGFFPLVPFSPYVGYWYHLAVTREGNVFTIYINGTPEGSETRDVDILNADAPLLIGQSGEPFGGFMDGILDEITIYNRALTEAELQAIVTAGRGGKCKELRIVTSALPSVRIGQTFSRQLEAMFGAPPYSWSVVMDTLPAGVALSTDGILSGTASQPGEYPFTIRVTDSIGDFAEKAFVLKVLLTLPPPEIIFSKTGTTPVPGRKTDYFIYIENVGDITTDTVQVTELLFPPDLFEFISAAPTPLEMNDFGLFWIIPSLDPGQVEIIQYSVNITPTTPLGESIPGALDVRVSSNIHEASQEWANNIQSLSCKINSSDCQNFLSYCKALGCHPFSLPISTVCAACPAHWEDCTANCDHCELYPETWSVSCGESSGPVDPNEKLVNAKKYIQSDRRLIYPIHFENIGTVEAIDVFITDTLDANLDLSILEILTPNGASVDTANRIVKWELLGRNLQPEETDNVLLAIKPNPGLPPGTEIRNTAEIQFDIFDPFLTNEVLNIIDDQMPVSQMDTLPAVSFESEFNISWSGVDSVGEIAHYTIFVSVDSSDYAEHIIHTKDTTAVFTGQPGKTYRFICVAEDVAGNIEAKLPIAEATTTVDSLAPTTLKVYAIANLQGAYDANAGLMRDNLRANNNLPLTEPYTALGYTHVGGGGGETTSQEVLDINDANAVVDWLFLELRDPSDFSVVLATRSALLQRDGDVVDVDGISPVAFPGLPEGEYYVAVKHRNHLGVMSTEPVALSAEATVVDFTNDINNAFGGINGIATLGDGHLGLYSGDFNRNGQVQNTDYAGMVLTIGIPGYVSGDLDLNGQVQNVDVQFHLVPNIGRGQAFGQ